MEFEKKLIEFGMSYTINNEGFYTILNQKRLGNPITVRLISSLPVNNQISGSKNDNEVQGIGIFKFKFISSGHDPDILTFAFQNYVKNKVEFLIIPTHEFLKRHFKIYPGSFCHKSVIVEVWLMEDGFVYDTTSLSLEGEWYFLSKGTGGRMADGTDIDCTGFLNNWLKLIFDL